MPTAANLRQVRFGKGKPRRATRSRLVSIGPPYADRRIGIGKPNATRIISFVHPAQHLYFQGSSIEIAKLSPLLSSPPSAPDAHRVTYFRPTFLRFFAR